MNRGLANAHLESLLDADHEWLQLSQEGFNVDLLTVEGINQKNLGRAGRDLLTEAAAELERAALLYQGDLMDGWSCDWLADERERSRGVFVALAEKLCDYYEFHGQAEATLAWSERILSADPAHERTHQRSMRVLYSSGDRTAALRQFQRCAKALSRELDVAPSPRTVALAESIRADIHEFPSNTQLLGGNIVRLRGYITRLDALIRDLDRDLSSMFVQPVSPRGRRTPDV